MKNELNEGDELYSISTGKVVIWKKASREASKFISSQPGFKASHVTSYGGTLWLFDSLNNAKSARNMMKLCGIQVGYNICRFTYENGALIFDEDFAKREGLIK